MTTRHLAAAMGQHSSRTPTSSTCSGGAGMQTQATQVCASSGISFASEWKEATDSRLALRINTELFAASVGCKDVCLIIARFHTDAVIILFVAAQPPLLHGQCMCVMWWRASLHNGTALTPLLCCTQVASWRMTGLR
jgi:hypothetical protein